MLSLLHIENIALIQSADIRFEPGFNVLTGETGAGKSIVIDSIGAVLGERTSRELIRTGAKSALVTAVFTQVPPLPWLEENGFPTGEEELLLQRELQGDGRNVCRIDGKLVTVAQLRELGRQLLNIHGQHDGQQLLDPASHLGYLDQFGGCQPLLESYQEAYRKWHDIRREMDKLQMDEAERSRRVDTLNYQIQELERAQLKAGEDEELSARRTLLRSAGKLMEAVQSAEFALSGDEDRDGACSLIAQAEGEVQGVSSISPELSELSEKLTALRCAADDAAEAALKKELEAARAESGTARSQLREQLAHTQEVQDNVEQFVPLIQKYTDIQELTPHILNELIEKIVVHEKKVEEDGSKSQMVEIHYKFVGCIDLSAMLNS